MSLYESQRKTEREEDDVKMHREEGQETTEAEMEAMQLQGMPRIAGSHWKLGKSKEGFFL